MNTLFRNYPIRVTAVLAVVLVAVIPQALAQMAAPPLNPVKGAATPNPAVVQWGGTDQLGGTASDGDGSILTPAGIEFANGELTSREVNLRVVGTLVSLGASGISTELRLSPVGGAPFQSDIEVEERRVVLAFPVGENLAVGGGLEQVETINTASVAPPISPFAFSATSRSEDELVLAGVSLRLAGVFFLGGAWGRETITRDNQGTLAGVPFSEQFEDTRDVRRAALGIFSRNAEGDALHLEAAFEERDPIEDPNPAAPPDVVEEIETSSATVEVVYANILLGLDKETRKIFSKGVQAEETELRGLSVGWLPVQGLSLTFTRVESEVELLDGLIAPSTQEFETNVVNLTLLF